MPFLLTTWSYGSSTAGAWVKKGEKANMTGGVEGRLATQNDVDRTHCVLTWDVLMPSLMTMWPYGSSMAGARVKQGEKANIAGGVEGRLATQNDMDIMQYILTWDARMPSLMTKWPYSSTAGGENGRKRVKKSEPGWRSQRKVRNSNM
jgi:hypothetical protein